ncbi:MAG: hypothetical protein ACOX87_13195, partial [Chloroflexota bacterium]
MRRLVMPERALSHMATALGVLGIAVLLTSSPFDRVIQSNQTVQIEHTPTTTAIDQAIDGQVALAESEVQESPLKRLLDNQNDSSVSSRGGQRSI